MQPHSLILITVDCLRADHVGFLGYPSATTPFLDCLAAESIHFKNAVAAGTPTYYAFPAIMASRYPLALGRDAVGIAPGESTLASVLQEGGFETAAFCAANPYISPRFGYDQGFQVFADFLQTPEVAEPVYPGATALRSRANRFLADACHSIDLLSAAYDELYFRYCHRVNTRRDLSLDELRRFPSADVLMDRALRWLRENSHRRFFLWLHFMDPHGPYVPKAEALKMMGREDLTAEQILFLNSYWNRDLPAARLRAKRDAVTALYDAGIRWVDEQIRRMAENLVDLNLWDSCALAVTADHGEEFLEHGGRYHVPRKLTEELIHVPLLLRVPGQMRGVAVESPFSMLDLAPTLLDVVGIPSPADFRGRSRWGEVRKGSPQEKPLVTECVYECSNPFHSQGRLGPRILAVRFGGYKLVVNFSSGSEELYDLSRDPLEQSPLPLNDAKDVRVALMRKAKKHVVESSQSRDFDKRMASRLRDFRLEFPRSAAHICAN